MKRKIGIALLTLGTLGLLISAGSSWYLFGQLETVTMIVPHDASIVEMNRSMYLAGDPIVDVYGNSMGKPVRVVVKDKSKILRPPEDTTLQLLPVDKQKGENPMQEQSIWLFLKPMLAGSIGAALAGAWLFKKK
ncbi:MAG: hypothetical protein OEM52_11595 [bacterium]|nr:hypothetical protein [bacterium]